MTGGIQIRDSLTFFEKALSVGIQNGRITPEKVEAILRDGPKGIVQIAQAFETPYKRSGLEAGMRRMVALVSLYLENESGGDIEKAIDLIESKPFLGLSRSGSQMVKRLGGLGSEEEKIQTGNTGDIYTLFNTPIPWVEGGMIKKYRVQYTERDKMMQRENFKAKIATLAGIKVDGTKDIINDIFPLVITGKTILSEALDMITKGQYDLNKWNVLLGNFEGEFPDIINEFRAQACLSILTGQGFEELKKVVDLEADLKSFGSYDEWGRLFDGQRAYSLEERITACITGAILGGMRLSISFEEFIDLCKQARKGANNLDSIVDYTIKNTPPGHKMGEKVLHYLNPDWDRMIQRKRITNRSSEINVLKQYFQFTEK